MHNLLLLLSKLEPLEHLHGQYNAPVGDASGVYTLQYSLLSEHGRLCVSVRAFAVGFDAPPVIGCGFSGRGLCSASFI